MDAPEFILDIETTIPATKLRVGGLYSVKHDITTEFFCLSDFLEALSVVKPGQAVGTWNGARFDMHTLKQIWGIDLEAYFLEKGIIHVDGMFLAKLLLPELHSHSLHNMAKHYFPAAPHMWKDPVPTKWEEKVKFYNETPIRELADYMVKDLLVTAGVFKKLCSSDLARNESASWTHPLKIEQAVGEIVQRQVDQGVAFDAAAAIDLKTTLTDYIRILHDRLLEDMPIVPIPEKDLHHPPKKQFKVDGTPTESIKKYCDKYGYKVDRFPGKWMASHAVNPNFALPLTRPLVTVEQLHPGQTARLKQHLLEMGWKPTQYNKKKDSTGKYVRTSPLLADKTTKEPCPNLIKMGVDWIPTLVDWMRHGAKLNILMSTKGTGLIPLSETGPDGLQLLRSDADTCGTPTSRFRHRGIVNIPRTTSFMGKEMRSLFIARPGYKMVGWDAEGLEARMEAHYVFPFDPEYAKTIVEGNSADGTDLHTLNWKRLGLKSRDDAKTFKYAITYGARPTKIAEQLGVSVVQATEWYESFWATNAGLSEFVAYLQKEWASLHRKYIVGLDGRLITTRKEHALLNSKLQGGGAVVMKHSMIIADKLISKEFSSEVAHGLIRYHDEEQWEVQTEFAERVGELGVRSVIEAGRYLKLNVPMDASYKVGNNWAETH